MPRKAQRAAKRKLDPASTVRVPKKQVNPMQSSEGKMGRTADFSQLGYKVIEGGQYEVEAMSYEWKDPKEIANPKPDQINPRTGKRWQYANVKLQVVDATDAEGNDVEGHVLFDKFSENPKSLFVLKRTAIAFGEDPSVFEPERGPDGKPLPLNLDLDEILGNLVGRRALATVAKGTFKGEDGDRETNEITKYEAVEQPTALSASRR
jgi:hypothetical protein